MLPEFTRSLYQRFEREDITLLLAGGWAVCHHGYSRDAPDIDWVCSKTKEFEAIALMDQLGFKKITFPLASRFIRRNQPEFPYIDIIWVDDISIEKMMEPGQNTGLQNEIPVISFRALLAMKLHSLKRDDPRDKDLIDLRMLLRYNPNNIDESELRAMCDRYAVPDVYRQLRDNP